MATVLVALNSLTPRASAAAYVIGLSPNYSHAEQTNVLSDVLLFILEGAQPGDQLVFCDALNQRLVAKCAIPEGKLFQANARARAQRLALEMAALRNFILADRPHPPEMTSVLLVPQFLEFAATQIRRPGEPLRVILIGSPFYMNADEPAFNMDDVYPSDAHLTAEQRESVFGTALKKRTLNGVTVHYAYLRAAFLNDFHQERITRFWSLFIRQQQGVLATFAPDINLAFQRARENIQQPCVDAQLDANDTKIQMLAVVRRQIPLWFGPTNVIQKVVETVDVPHVTLVASTPPPKPAPPPVTNTVTVVEPPPPAPPPSQTNAPPAPLVVASSPPPAPSVPPPVTPAPVFPIKPTANQVGVGIMWGAPVDCDLYVRAAPSAQELFYRNTRTREGRYFHDHRNANLSVDYEYVELKAPVDLTRVSAWVNYYSGKASLVRGIVVLFYEGRSSYGDFELTAPKGNSGFDSAYRGKSKYWTRLDLVNFITAGSQIRPAGVPR